jgi:hypothetical protein
MREAVDARRRGLRDIVQRLGDHSQAGRLPEPVAGGIGGQAGLDPHLAEAGRGGSDAQFLDTGQAQADARERDPVHLRDERRGVLPALAHDDVRLPPLDDRPQAGQRGARVVLSEVLAQHPRVRLVDAELREIRQERHPLVVRRLCHGSERQAGAHDVALVLSLRSDEHVVPCAQAGVSERRQRQHVAGATASGHENPHCAIGAVTGAAVIRLAGVQGYGWLHARWELLPLNPNEGIDCPLSDVALPSWTSRGGFLAAAVSVWTAAAPPPGAVSRKLTRQRTAFFAVSTRSK